MSKNLDTQTRLTPTRIDWCAVTGMARSGTTIVGDTLGLGPRTVYVHEPFSPLGVQGVEWQSIGFEGEHMAPASEAARGVIEGLLRLRGRYGASRVPAEDPWPRRMAKRLIGGRGRNAWRYARLVAPFGRRGVLKDPFAWRFCPWLHTQHGVRVIAVIKHPVSQVASYARAGWRGNLSTLARHEAIVDQLDSSDRGRTIDESCSDAIAAARQWRWTYRLIGKWAERYGWRIVRIEDVSERPTEVFQDLFDALEWERPGSLDRVLQTRMGAQNPAEARTGVFQDLNRNSREIFRLRRASVPIEVRRQIFDETFDVASQWYDEASYALESEPATV